MKVQRSSLTLKDELSYFLFINLYCYRIGRDMQYNKYYTSRIMTSFGYTIVRKKASFFLL